MLREANQARYFSEFIVDHHCPYKGCNDPQYRLLPIFRRFTVTRSCPQGSPTLTSDSRLQSERAVLLRRNISVGNMTHLVSGG
jgi:hypothetical protein